MAQNKSILHVLNGDSTKLIFEKSGISGTVIVWREAFSDGTFKDQINASSFWKHRQHELGRLYGVQPDEYHEKTIEELSAHQHHYDEIIFWFEHDFYCQINLIGCMTYFHHSDHTADVFSLVCVGDEIRHGRKATLADYRPDEFPFIMNERINLTQDDFKKMNGLFDSFIRDDPNLFYGQIDEKSHFQFHRQMKKCYRNLFPIDHSSHSVIDQIIYDEMEMGKENIMDLTRRILLRTDDFGFGDLQVMHKIKLIFESEQGSPSYDSIGNVNRYSWFFDSGKQKFFPKKS